MFQLPGPRTIRVVEGPTYYARKKEQPEFGCNLFLPKSDKIMVPVVDKATGREYIAAISKRRYDLITNTVGLRKFVLCA